MLNALRVDIRRYMMTKIIIVPVFLAAVAIPLFTSVGIWGLGRMFDAAPSVTMDNLSGYSSMASIYLAAFVTLFLHAEAGEGIIRNKMISGKKRHHILLSYCLVNSMAAVFLQIVSVMVSVLAGIIAGADFQVEPSAIIRCTAVLSMAGIAVSIFYTAVYLIICTSRISVAVPGCIAVAMYIVIVFITDALYTESGIPKVSGLTLKIYEGIDRFVPFAHLTGGLRWENSDYIIGSVAMALVSILAGSVIFAKKDMN